MAANRDRLQREKDLSDLARRYLRGETQADIAHSLRVNQSTISRDIKALQKRWRAEAITDFDAARAEQLAKIDELERTYWEAWQKSLVREMRSSRKKEGAGAGSEALVRTETRDGNHAYLEGVRWCIERRCKLLGLNAPDRYEHTGAGGGPIKHESRSIFELDQEIDRLLAGYGPGEQEPAVRAADRLPPGFPKPV